MQPTTAPRPPRKYHHLSNPRSTLKVILIDLINILSGSKKVLGLIKKGRLDCSTNLSKRA